MSTPSIVIASAGRTAVGSFNGSFANTPAHELGAAVIKGVLERAGVDAGEVDEVILGQVLQAGEGQNPARQAAMKAGIPQEATAWGMNQLCGSGLRAVALGMQQIATGDARDHHRRRHGVHVDGAALRAPARRREDGRLQDDRHDDQGWPDRRLLRLPHGHHRRERRAPVAADARGAGSVRARLAEQGRGRPEGRPLRRRNHSLHRQGPQGRRHRRSGRIYPPWRHARPDGQAASGLRQGRHRHRRQRLRPQ